MTGGAGLGALTFFRYSFEGVLRNRRRSLFAVLGIALAMALVSGSLIAVDSSAYGLLRSAVSNVSVDFIAQQNNIDNATFKTDHFEGANNAILTVDKVQESIPMPTLQGYGWSIHPENSSYGYGGGYLAFLPSDGGAFLDRIGVSGEVPSNGTVAIPKEMADALNVGVSDSIVVSMTKSTQTPGPNLTWQYTTSYLNLSFQVSQLWTQDQSGSGQNNPYPGPIVYGKSSDSPYVWFPGKWESPIVMNMSSFDYVLTPEVRAFVAGNAQMAAMYYIQIDRESVVDLSNIGATVKDIQFIQHRLTLQGFSYGFTVTDSGLVTALQGMQPQLEAQKLTFIALSLPVVALGTYLSVVGVDLGVTSRRREIGILKSRGASNRHVFFSLVLESIVLGAGAAIIGLFTGILVSRFLLGSALSISSGDASGSASWTDFRLAGSSIELTIFFGVALMLLSSWRPFKRASKTDVAEALHHYSKAATSTEYRPRMDVALLGLSVLSIVSILVGFNWVTNTSWSWITKLIIGAVILVGTLIFPIMPFLLSLSVIRLMTRGPRRLYSKFGWFVKGWTKDLHQLVEKNILRNPRRASNIAVIISLAIAFGLFISVTMESSIGLAREQVKYDIGADIHVSGYARGGGMNLSKLDDLRSIQGVEHVALFADLYFTSGVSYYGFSSVVTNVTDYASAVNPTDFYFVHSGKEVLGDVAEKGSVLVNSQFADENSILVGDPMYATLYTGGWNGTSQKTYTIPLVVVGMAKGLPGLGSFNALLDYRSLSAIPSNDLNSTMTSMGALIDASKGADTAAIADSADSIFTQAGYSPTVTTMEDGLAALKTDLGFASLSDYLYMEYAMSIIIMSVGVGLIIFVAVTDREQELACIMARGSTSSQMRKILMGESFTLMTLGITVGAIVGLLSAFLYNTLTLPGSGGVVPHRMLFGLVSWAMIAVAGLSLVLAALMATARAGKIRLSEVLRIRGG